jgi:hypothetical protein
MRVVAALATLAAGIALACVMAYWGWQLFGPPAVRLASSGPPNPAATLIAADLFGGNPEQRASPVASRDAMLGSDARLIGIIAEEGQRGYALFRLASGPKLVAQGQDIVAGVTLVSVDATAVTIRDGGGERRLALRGDTASPRATPTGMPPNVPQRSAPRPVVANAVGNAIAACGPPAGFRGTIVRLNTELMNGVGAESVQWGRLLAPVTGGLVVREDNGFGAMLGLKVGDRLAQANGIALSVPEDVSSAIVRPLVANQGVRLIGSRDGATQELWLANVACAG